jgi:hypothetical protein
MPGPWLGFFTLCRCWHSDLAQPLSGQENEWKRRECLPDFNVLAVLTAILVGVAKTGVSGMAILVVPLIAMVLPAKESVGALLPMLIAGDILALIYYRQHAQWRQLAKLIPGVATGMLIGGFFLSQLDNQSMRIFLGVFVLLLLISDRTGIENPLISLTNIA